MKTRLTSPLIDIKKLSPNCTRPRKGPVRRLSPHCMAGNLTAERCLSLPRFQTPSPKGASCNYDIGSDGRIGLGVPETDRAWTTSSSKNDHEAITFELANVGGAPDWRIGDAAINAWMDLAVDIAEFYGFKKIHYEPKPDHITGSAAVEKWIATWAKDDEMIVTLHRWYKAKACPGNYFIRQLPWLVREMNKRLAGDYTGEDFVGEGATSIILKKGASGPDVEELQTLLNSHGANPALDVDGDFGGLTETELLDFQIKHKLPVTGIADAKTMTELRKPPAATPKPVVFLRKGDDGSDVEKLQKLLNAHGASPALKVDGDFGTLTETEVRDFQAKHDLPQTGEVDEKTWAELQKKPVVTSVSYAVRVNTSALNVRKGPGANFDVATTLRNDKNVYTIVEEKTTSDGSKWGRLKSGAGWIALKYTIKT